MTLAIDTAHRNLRLAATKSLIDEGVTGGVLHLYATARPATGAAPGAAPLVSILLTLPCGTVSSGSLSLTRANSGGDMITVSGIATWGRLVSGLGSLVADGDVSDSAGGATGDFKLAGASGTQLYAGGYVVLSSAILG